MSKFLWVILSISRISALFVAFFLFGWFNVFSYLVPNNSYSQNSLFWLSIGLVYAVLICLSFIEIPSRKIRLIVQGMHVILGAFIVLILDLSILFSFIFSQYWILFLSLFLALVLIGNGIAMIKYIDLFKKTRWVLWVTVLVSLIGLGMLTYKWQFFAEKISCSGVSMTTAGSYEKWTYTLPRLHCWSFKLSDSSDETTH